VGPTEPLEEEALRELVGEPLAQAVPEAAERRALEAGERAPLEPPVVERRAAAPQRERVEGLAALAAARAGVVERPEARNTCGLLESTCTSRRLVS
jgi:hypothetical protein